MTKQKHTHKFKRLKYKSGTHILFCALPDCSFKINPALALGKRSICWRCGDEFILNEYSLRLAKPHCESCHKPKEKKKEYSVSELSIPYGESETARELPRLTLSERLRQTIAMAKEASLKNPEGENDEGDI